MIYIIGDSFAQAPAFDKLPKNKTIEDCYWVEVLKKNYPNQTFYVDGASSRDVQTILDNWIKLLPNLKIEDKVILILPYFARTRLPIQNPISFTNNRNEIIYENRYIGTQSYNTKLIKLDGIDESYTPEKIEQSLLLQQVINQTDASHLNWFDIIKSLKKITICDVLIFCWDNLKIKCDDIIDKELIIDGIGYWESHDDLYHKTNGIEGIKGDKHWSFRYNLVFGNFVVTKF